MFVLQHQAEELLDSQAGAGLAQIRILGTLTRDVPRSQKLVARQLRQTEANASRQLRLMQRQGLVSVKANKQDKRQKDVTLTSKGAQKYEKAKKLLQAQQKDLLRLLNKNERQTFEHALNNLLKSLY